MNSYISIMISIGLTIMGVCVASSIIGFIASVVFKCIELARSKEPKSRATVPVFSYNEDNKENNIENN